MPPDAAQFTLGLFDSTALGWTIQIPRTEPEPIAPASVTNDEDTDRPDAERTKIGTGTNFYVDDDRGLARGWPSRARDNIAAIRLSKELEATGRGP
ncbi:MAG: hypothetical protein M3Y22_13135, partial [Pseudomonadota bacterium]|nr:hypothetical protein [Pseudomonadota bacterium]